MSRTDRDQVFQNGVLISETTRQVDDATIFREDAPKRLKQAYTRDRQWAQDARDATAAWDGQTQAQKNATMKIVITRLGVFFDDHADMLLYLSLDT